MFLDKNKPITNTIDTKYKYINMNPTIQPMHPHPNDKPRQKKSRLTDITYVNKGYNAKSPPNTKSMTQQKEQYLKVHIEPQNPSLAVIIKKKQTHADLARYLHATCLSPARTTFTTAIKYIFSKHGQDSRQS